MPPAERADKDLTNVVPLARTSRRTGMLASITVLLALTASLCVAEYVLRWQRAGIERSDVLDAGMIVFDTGIGWRLRPDWQGRHRHHDFDVAYSITQDGLRTTPPAVATSAQPDQIVALIGDSFTFAQGVNDAETFAAELARQLGASSRVLNFGVPGTSTDQQLLLVSDRLPAYGATDVVLVVYLGNDLFDNQLLRPLQGRQPKPRFRLTGGGLVLDAVGSTDPRGGGGEAPSLTSVVLGDAVAPGGPLDSLSSLEIAHRLGLRPPEPEVTDAHFDARFADALNLFNALRDEFDSEVRRQGARLHVALLCGRSHAMEPVSISGRFQEYLRARLAASMRDQAVIDLASTLRATANAGDDGLFFRYDGHLTARGNAIVAAELAVALSLRQP